MSTNARIIGQQSLNRFVLELSYSGLAQPEALFAELTTLGWRVPPPPPRPATAIDWDTPDPDAGTAYTIVDWQVDGVAPGPPSGSGIGGRWNEEERAKHLRAVRDVLARNRVTVHEVDIEPDERTAAAPAGPTASSNGEDSRHDLANGSESARPASAAPVVSEHVGRPMAQLVAVVAPDRATVLEALCAAMDRSVRCHGAVATTAVGVAARPGTPERPSVGWYEAELTVEDLETSSGSTLLSSPLFRHGLWVCHPVSGSERPGLVEGMSLIRGIVPADDVELVGSGIDSFCGVTLTPSAVQSNGRNADVLLEGLVEPVLFDAVCAEIVRIAPDSVCRGTAT